MAQDLNIGAHFDLSIKTGALIHHKASSAAPVRLRRIAFPPEAGKRSLLPAAYISIRLSRRSSAPPQAGFRRAQLTSDTFLVIRNPPRASNFSKDS
jgi:hypothetical protein